MSWSFRARDLKCRRDTYNWQAILFFLFAARKKDSTTNKQTNKQYQSSCSCSVLHKKGEDVQCLSAGLSKAQGSLQNTYCQKVSSADRLQSRQNRATVRSFVVVCRLRSGSSSTGFVSSSIIISSPFCCSECFMAGLRDVCVCAYVRACVRACVCVSLSPSLVSSAIASAVPNLSLRSQPVSQQLLNRSLHYCKFLEDHYLCYRN
jgi:hypothetical protein